MPAMKELQIRNHCSNVAGAARSYGVIVINGIALILRTNTLSNCINRYLPNITAHFQHTR